MKDTSIGYLLALFTIMMWSMNIIYAKYLAGIFTPSEISFYRWFIALFIMVPISFKALKSEWKLLLKNWKMIILMALSGLGLQNWLIYCAGYTASATNMSLISILGPVFLILMSKQKINIWQIIGIFAAIFGVIIIILRGKLANLASFQLVSGDVYMLGSAFLFAVYALLQRHTPNNVESRALLTAGIFVSALMYFFPALPHIISTPLRTIPWLAWASLAALGIINSALAYLSWDTVIKKIGTINAGSMYYTLPIFSISAAHVLLHEKIYEIQLWGALLIVTGVIFVIFGTAKIQNKSR